MTMPNPYLNVLRSLEAELFPIIALERPSSGTFRLPPPRGIKVAEALCGITMIFAAGVSARRFVQRRSRVRLSTSASQTGLISATNLFLGFSFLNCAFQLLYLSYLPSPHHTLNLFASSFRNLLLLAQALALSIALTTEAVDQVSAVQETGCRTLKSLRGKRFRVFSTVVGSILLLADFAVSLETLFSSFALRDSFFKARVNLLLLATSPSDSAGATTTSIMRVLAGPIGELQRDLQRLRWSEIGKDAVQVASQIFLMLFYVLLLSKVSSHIPRFAAPLRTLPRRIRFKRASSISKLPVAVEPEAQATILDEEASNQRNEIRESVSAVVAFTIVLFIFTMLSNYILALDILGRRWTAPLESFEPTQLWSSYLYLGFTLSTLLCLSYRSCTSSPSTSSFSLPPVLLPLTRLRTRRPEPQQQGYIVPLTGTPFPSPPASLLSCGISGKEDVSTPETISGVPVLTSYPFPTVGGSSSSMDSLTSDEVSGSEGDQSRANL
ncbi:hypothetical protein JCM16303_004376 [Sporobolomyces ruberrimus]